VVRIELARLNDRGVGRIRIGTAMCGVRAKGFAYSWTWESPGPWHASQAMPNSATWVFISDRLEIFGIACVA